MDVIRDYEGFGTPIYYIDGARRPYQKWALYSIEEPLDVPTLESRKARRKIELDELHWDNTEGHAAYLEGERMKLEFEREDREAKLRATIAAARLARAQDGVQSNWNAILMARIQALPGLQNQDYAAFLQARNVL